MLSEGHHSSRSIIPMVGVGGPADSRHKIFTCCHPQQCSAARALLGWSLRSIVPEIEGSLGLAFKAWDQVLCWITLSTNHQELYSNC